MPDAQLDALDRIVASLPPDSMLHRLLVAYLARERAASDPTSVMAWM